MGLKCSAIRLEIRRMAIRFLGVMNKVRHRQVLEVVKVESSPKAPNVFQNLQALGFLFFLGL